MTITTDTNRIDAFLTKHKAENLNLEYFDEIHFCLTFQIKHQFVATAFITQIVKCTDHTYDLVIADEHSNALKINLGDDFTRLSTYRIRRAIEQFYSIVSHPFV